MQLTKHTDYAFRVLMTLAVKPASHNVTISHIAERFDISHNHLMKVVQKLVQQGWVKSTRGAKGGLSLGCDAHSINLLAVVEAMEPTLTPINCHQPECILAHQCRLQTILNQAQQQFSQYLARFSLADAISPTTRDLLFAHRLHSGD